MTSSSPYHAALLMGKNTTRGAFAVLVPVATLGFFVLFVAGKRNRGSLDGRRWTYGLAGSIALLVAIGVLFAAGGCGYNANSTANGTQRGTTTVMITGTSGSLTHSASVTLTVQ